jgi:hypothetical protein
MEISGQLHAPMYQNKKILIIISKIIMMISDWCSQGAETGIKLKLELAPLNFLIHIFG